MIFRDATLEDTQAIALLLSDLGYPASIDAIRLRYKDLFDHNDYKTLLAIDNYGLVIGMVGMLQSLSYEHSGKYVRILAMVVSKESRNKGIGKLLINEAELWAKEIGVDTIVLNSGNRQERQDAYIFYQKMGFEIKSSGFIKKL